MSVNDLAYAQAQQAGYMIANSDENQNLKYYGFMDRFGHWYILLENTTEGSFRYVKGNDGYPDNWTARASQEYGYPTVFNI